jgi:hypothetical protein
MVLVTVIFNYILQDNTDVAYTHLPRKLVQAVMFLTCLHSGDVRIKSQLKTPAILIGSSWYISKPSTNNPVQQLKLSHGRFLSHYFQFIITNIPFHTRQSEIEIKVKLSLLRGHKGP